jgi:predicted metalloprotease
MKVNNRNDANCITAILTLLCPSNIVEAGDIEAALCAARSIGDDRIQKQSQGYVVPESFTHGSSEHRVRCFKRGIETGDFSQCNTFTTGDL